MKKIITVFLSLSLLSPLFSFSAQAKNVQNKYSQIRQQYRQEVGFYKNAKQDFMKSRAKFQKFKTAENKNELEDIARQFLDHIVASMIKRLESIKQWVANKASLEDEEKQSIIAEINEDITWLENKKSSLPGMSIDEIRNTAKEIRNYWKSHRAKVKKISGHIFAARIKYIINKSEKVSERVDKKITELKQNGYDTVKLEKLLADFKAKIELAKEKYEAAKAEYEKIGNTGDANDLLKKAREFSKQAHTYLKEARNILKQIIEEMKNLK